MNKMIEGDGGVGGNTETQLAALRAKMAELRVARNPQPVAHGRFTEHIADKPEKFKGKYGNVVKGWIAHWETFFIFTDSEKKYVELQ
jgi:hypothetical protein